MLEITRAELEELFISIGMPKSRVSEESDAKLLGRIHLLPEKIESGQLPKNPDGKQLDFIQRVCTAIKDGTLKIVHQKSTVTRVFVPVKDGVDSLGFKENSVGFRVNQVLTDKFQTLSVLAEKAETKLSNVRIHLKKLVDSGKVLHDSEKGYCLPKRRGRPNIKKTESEEMKTKTKKESKVKNKPAKTKKETKPAKVAKNKKEDSTLPRNKYYDVSKWNPYNSAAVSAAKKMARMEESAKSKDIESVKAHLPKTKMDSSLNNYAKKVFQVYEIICEELGKKCVLPERFKNPKVKEENEVKTKTKKESKKSKDKKETKVKAKKETKPAKTKVKTETKEKKTKKEGKKKKQKV